MDFLTLDWGGVVLAFVFGALFLFLGMWLGVFFLLAMIVFLLLSAIVTYIDLGYKKRLGIGQEPRGVRNVLANGLPPMIIATVFYLSVKAGNGSVALLAVIGFIASVAAITADKFSSEIGVLSRGNPRMIFSMKKVRKGTSGAISLLGIASGFIGALVVALLTILVARGLFVFRSAYPFGIEKAIFSIAFAGFIGSIVDSALGYYEERGIGNKYTSNFLCGVAAGIIAMLVFALL